MRPEDRVAIHEAMEQQILQSQLSSSNFACIFVILKMFLNTSWLKKSYGLGLCLLYASLDEIATELQVSDYLS